MTYAEINKWIDEITEKYTVKDTDVRNSKKLAQAEEILKEQGEYF